MLASRQSSPTVTRQVPADWQTAVQAGATGRRTGFWRSGWGVGGKGIPKERSGRPFGWLSIELDAVIFYVADVLSRRNNLPAAVRANSVARLAGLRCGSSETDSIATVSSFFYRAARTIVPEFMFELPQLIIDPIAKRFSEGRLEQQMLPRNLVGLDFGGRWDRGMLTWGWRTEFHGVCPIGDGSQQRWHARLGVSSYSCKGWTEAGEPWRTAVIRRIGVFLGRRGVEKSTKTGVCCGEKATLGGISGGFLVLVISWPDWGSRNLARGRKKSPRPTRISGQGRITHNNWLGQTRVESRKQDFQRGAAH